MHDDGKLIAITHLPSPRMQGCVRTFVDQVEIDCELALEQHAAYRQVLQESGATVITLDINRDLPDSVFIEDAAVVLDEMAVIGVMGTESRRAETNGIAWELETHRSMIRLKSPATLEGGDVLRVGKTLLVGLSSRTNREGIEALERIARPLGYRVVAVPVHGCLHLKTGCTALPDGTLLVNPQWVDLAGLGFELVEVPQHEPWGANVLPVSSNVVVPRNHPSTAEMTSRRGLNVRLVDISEFQKAEGGVTCLSILMMEERRV